MPELQIRPDHVRQIIEQARRDYPREACGLVGGRIGRRAAVADVVLAVKNVAARPQARFEMDRAMMVSAILGLQRAGREVVAIYHSHPAGDARPSRTDIIEANWPDAVYLIVGLAKTDLLAWTIRSGRADPATLTVLEES